MKIRFDAQIFESQIYGGISRYFVELARHLDLGMAGDDVRILAPFYSSAHLRDGSCKVQGCYFPYLRRPSLRRLKSAINRRLVQRWLARDGADILHETFYTPVPTATGIRTILTVYDMINEKYPCSTPDHALRVSRKRKAVEHADHIICISENTRRDLMDFLQVPAGKITVIHLGLTTPHAGVGQLSSLVNEPYILFVGSRDGYKNFSRLAMGFASYPALYKNFKLICLGGEQVRGCEKWMLRDLGLSDEQVLFLRGDDRLLSTLYQRAAALVYPSLYEGFGIPPLEAMASSCPVVCSNTSSLPEVVGQAGEYFDPLSVDMIASAILKVVESPTRADELRKLGALNVTRFSWEKCAQEHRAVYQKVLNASR